MFWIHTLHNSSKFLQIQDLKKSVSLNLILCKLNIFLYFKKISWWISGRFYSEVITTISEAQHIKPIFKRTTNWDNNNAYPYSQLIVYTVKTYGSNLLHSKGWTPIEFAIMAIKGEGKTPILVRSIQYSNVQFDLEIKRAILTII